MSDLFDAAPRTGSMPLAAELRPATLDDVIGQEKVIGPGTMLRRRIAAGRLGSIILYGPPGLGKTSIARAIGNMLGKNFRPLHAAHNNVADIRKIADEARMVIIYGVAQLIEQSYFPEQNDGEGPAARFGRLYDVALAALAKNQASYSAASRAGGGRSLGSMRVGAASAQWVDQWP